MKRPDKISSVVLWSVISAAFIGPGTVTTAVTAGSQFKLELLWAITFATISCIILQEVSARISIVSGMTFGESLVKRFGKSHGVKLQWIIGGAVVLGCAAYEAGNILGAVSGMILITGWNATVLTIIISVTAGVVLWVGGRKWISNIMISLVAIMGIAFTSLALSQSFSMGELISASFVPSIPAGSELLVLGLVGTTIVPYSIFIGSGISKGQTLPLMRIGLVISILIGGFITATILVAGIGVQDFSSFLSLSQSISQQVGTWGSIALALGLFAAGFSSAITSPYAASLIATTVFGIEKKNTIRMIWGSVLLTGFIFGVSGIKPIPVILAVQALNGLILPLITAYLIIIVNDHKLMSEKDRHAPWYNFILLSILAIVLLISLNNIDKTVASLFKTAPHFEFMLIATALITGWIAWIIFSKKRVSLLN